MHITRTMAEYVFVKPYLGYFKQNDKYTSLSIYDDVNTCENITEKKPINPKTIILNNVQIIFDASKQKVARKLINKFSKNVCEKIALESYYTEEDTVCLKQQPKYEFTMYYGINDIHIVDIECADSKYEVKMYSTLNCTAHEPIIEPYIYNKQWFNIMYCETCQGSISPEYVYDFYNLDRLTFYKKINLTDYKLYLKSEDYVIDNNPFENTYVKKSALPITILYDDRDNTKLMFYDGDHQQLVRTIIQNIICDNKYIVLKFDGVYFDDIKYTATFTKDSKSITLYKSKTDKCVKSISDSRITFNYKEGTEHIKYTNILKYVINEY